MRSPKWHRDEIILALNLYLDPYRGSIDANNPNVIKLSELLNSLPIFEEKPNSEKFRNPNGVSLKLSNFLALDPKYPGKGMAAYSKLDKIVFEEFYDDRTRLIKISRTIQEILSDEKLSHELFKIESDEITIFDQVQEGQVLYKLHKYRERNPQIIEAKKKSVLRETSSLKCEVCNFDFKETFGDLGDGYIECHHIEPISNYENGKITKLEDLALVCANCHRMLHRKIETMTIADLRNMITYSS